MIVLDTSCLIRFFTNDDQKKALKVKKLLKREKEILIPQVVFAELEYVLKGSYKATRKEITKAFRFLVSQSNIKLEKIIKRAVGVYGKTKLDMADCLIVSAAIGNKLASWDKKMLSF
jgi:predicted nucleic-acid-binding protein